MNTGTIRLNITLIKTDQIRTLDKSRLVKFIGTLRNREMEQIQKAVKIHLALL